MSHDGVFDDAEETALSDPAVSSEYDDAPTDPQLFDWSGPHIPSTVNNNLDDREDEVIVTEVKTAAYPLTEVKTAASPPSSTDNKTGSAGSSVGRSAWFTTLKEKVIGFSFISELQSRFGYGKPSPSTHEDDKTEKPTNTNPDVRTRDEPAFVSPSGRGDHETINAASTTAISNSTAGTTSFPTYTFTSTAANHEQNAAKYTSKGPSGDAVDVNRKLASRFCSRGNSQVDYILENENGLVTRPLWKFAMPKEAPRRGRCAAPFLACPEDFKSPVPSASPVQTLRKDDSTAINAELKISDSMNERPSESAKNVQESDRHSVSQTRPSPLPSFRREEAEFNTGGVAVIHGSGQNLAGDLLTLPSLFREQEDSTSSRCESVGFQTAEKCSQETQDTEHCRPQDIATKATARERGERAFSAQDPLTSGAVAESDQQDQDDSDDEVEIIGSSEGVLATGAIPFQSDTTRTDGFQPMDEGLDPLSRKRPLRWLCSPSPATPKKENTQDSLAMGRQDSPVVPPWINGFTPTGDADAADDDRSQKRQRFSSPVGGETAGIVIRGESHEMAMSEEVSTRQAYNDKTSRSQVGEAIIGTVEKVPATNVEETATATRSRKKAKFDHVETGINDHFGEVGACGSQAKDKLPHSTNQDEGGNRRNCVRNISNEDDLSREHVEVVAPSNQEERDEVSNEVLQRAAALSEAQAGARPQQRQSEEESEGEECVNSPEELSTVKLALPQQARTRPFFVGKTHPRESLPQTLPGDTNRARVVEGSKPSASVPSCPPASILPHEHIETETKEGSELPLVRLFYLIEKETAEKSGNLTWDTDGKSFTMVWNAELMHRTFPSWKKPRDALRHLLKRRKFREENVVNGPRVGPCRKAPVTLTRFRSALFYRGMSHDELFAVASTKRNTSGTEKWTGRDRRSRRGSKRKVDGLASDLATASDAVDQPDLTSNRNLGPTTSEGQEKGVDATKTNVSLPIHMNDTTTEDERGKRKLTRRRKSTVGVLTSDVTTVRETGKRCGGADANGFGTTSTTPDKKHAMETGQPTENRAVLRSVAGCRVGEQLRRSIRDDVAIPSDKSFNEDPRSRNEKFHRSLHEMLDDPENACCLWWEVDGKSFTMIDKHERLCESIRGKLLSTCWETFVQSLRNRGFSTEMDYCSPRKWRVSHPDFFRNVSVERLNSRKGGDQISRKKEEARPSQTAGKSSGDSWHTDRSPTTLACDVVLESSESESETATGERTLPSSMGSPSDQVSSVQTLPLPPTDAMIASADGGGDEAGPFVKPGFDNVDKCQVSFTSVEACQRSPEVGFLTALHEMIHHESEKKFGVMSWDTDGRSFTATSQNDAVLYVLSEYFSVGKTYWDAFVDHLRMLGFSEEMVVEKSASDNLSSQRMRFQHEGYHRGMSVNGLRRLDRIERVQFSCASENNGVTRVDGNATEQRILAHEFNARPQFSWRLYIMIEEETRKNSGFVSWDDDGLSFTLSNERKEMHRVVRLYFSEFEWGRKGKPLDLMMSRLRVWGFKEHVESRADLNNRRRFSHGTFVRRMNAMDLFEDLGVAESKIVKTGGKAEQSLSSAESFPETLFRLLLEQTEKNSKLFSWDDDGRSFSMLTSDTEALATLWQSHFPSQLDPVCALTNELQCRGFKFEDTYDGRDGLEGVRWRHDKFSRDMSAESITVSIPILPRIARGPRSRLSAENDERRKSGVDTQSNSATTLKGDKHPKESVLDKWTAASFFPVLMKLLDEQSAANSKLISWDDDGRSFRMSADKSALNKVMRPYFQSKDCAKYVHNWLRRRDFEVIKRVGETKGGTYHTYQHEKFFRGASDVDFAALTEVTRIRVSKKDAQSGVMAVEADGGESGGGLETQPNIMDSGRHYPDELADHGGSPSFLDRSSACVHARTGCTETRSVETVPPVNESSELFLWKLHEMLEDETTKGSAMLSWDDDGTSFTAVSDKNEEWVKLLERYFPVWCRGQHDFCKLLLSNGFAGHVTSPSAWDEEVRREVVRYRKDGFVRDMHLSDHRSNGTEFLRSDPAKAEVNSEDATRAQDSVDDGDPVSMQNSIDDRESGSEQNLLEDNSLEDGKLKDMHCAVDCGEHQTAQNHLEPGMMKDALEDGEPKATQKPNRELSFLQRLYDCLQRSSEGNNGVLMWEGDGKGFILQGTRQPHEGDEVLCTSFPEFRNNPRAKLGMMLRLYGFQKQGLQPRNKGLRYSLHSFYRGMKSEDLLSIGRFTTPRADQEHQDGDTVGAKVSDSATEIECCEGKIALPSGHGDVDGTSEQGETRMRVVTGRRCFAVQLSDFLDMQSTDQSAAFSWDCDGLSFTVDHHGKKDHESLLRNFFCQWKKVSDPWRMLERSLERVGFKSEATSDWNRTRFIHSSFRRGMTRSELDSLPRNVLKKEFASNKRREEKQCGDAPMKNVDVHDTSSARGRLRRYCGRCETCSKPDCGSCTACLERLKGGALQLSGVGHRCTTKLNCKKWRSHQDSSDSTPSERRRHPRKRSLTRICNTNDAIEASDCTPTQMAANPAESQQPNNRPLDPPPPVPSLPDTGRCAWAFNSETRVLLANFRQECGRVDVHGEDELFLRRMMERDDITVVCEGLADDLDVDLWDLAALARNVEGEFCHKFRAFRKELLTASEIQRDAAGNAVACSAGKEASDGEDSAKRFVTYKELHGFKSMKMSQYVEYLRMRERALQRRAAVVAQKTNLDSSMKCDYGEDDQEEDNDKETFCFENHKGEEMTINVVDVVLYLLDYDVSKLMPPLYEDFANSFKLPGALPGGSYCMMNSVNPGGRPFMGPNLYITPPASFTHLHQDGHGTVDSGHQCISGYNEVVMLRRMPEEHKLNALRVLQGNGPTDNGGKPYDALYGLPHGDENGEKPMWPSVSAIAKCKELNYCPSVFVLKPGQYVHINKGRLHAFRKLSLDSLPETDCHSAHRKRTLIEDVGDSKEPLCISLAWDWMYRGVTSAGIRAEVESTLECAALNRKHCKQSLAIPETCVLHMAKLLANGLSSDKGPESKLPMVPQSNRSVTASRTKQPEEIRVILEGLLPPLQKLVQHHHRDYTSMKGISEKSGSLSVADRPNSWEIPENFALDPYGNTDFFCKLCHQELSNLYLHCDGCEEILSKDFNICVRCYTAERHKTFVPMHPCSGKLNSAVNHTGNFYFRKSKCQCGVSSSRCERCHSCACCSCSCHTAFTLHMRFMRVEDEVNLLRKIEFGLGETLGQSASLISGRETIEESSACDTEHLKISDSTQSFEIQEPLARVNARQQIHGLIKGGLTVDQLRAIVEAAPSSGDNSLFGFRSASALHLNFPDSSEVSGSNENVQISSVEFDIMICCYFGQLSFVECERLIPYRPTKTLLQFRTRIQSLELQTGWLSKAERTVAEIRKNRSETQNWDFAKQRKGKVILTEDESDGNQSGYDLGACDSPPACEEQKTAAGAKIVIEKGKCRRIPETRVATCADSKRGKKGTEEPFLRALHRMLHEESKNYGSFAWTPDGKGFRMKRNIEKSVLGKYFVASSLRTFFRNLIRHGFVSEKDVLGGLMWKRAGFERVMTEEELDCHWEEGKSVAGDLVDDIECSPNERALIDGEGREDVDRAVGTFSRNNVGDKVEAVEGSLPHNSHLTAIGMSTSSSETKVKVEADVCHEAAKSQDSKLSAAAVEESMLPPI